jgi:hypothetical protein
VFGGLLNPLDTCVAIDSFDQHTDSPFGHNEQQFGHRFATMSGDPKNNCELAISLDKAKVRNQQFLTGSCVGCPIIDQTISCATAIIPTGIFIARQSIMAQGMSIGPITVTAIYESGAYTCNPLAPATLVYEPRIYQGTATYSLALIPFNSI